MTAFSHNPMLWNSLQPGSMPRLPGRASRVLALALLIFIANAVDLWLTLDTMRTVGMFESNPVVHAIVALTGSGLAIAGLKALVTVFAVGVLLALRGRWQAELGAWAALTLMLYVSWQWIGYMTVMSGLDPEMLRVLAEGDRHWISL